MQADTTITQESPLTDDLALLFDRHTQAMHADSPPESIHMLDRADLVSPDIRLLVLRIDGRPAAMGAVKLDPSGQGELKSMHVLSVHRGQGLAAQMLDALLDLARASGLARVSLETGAQPSFAPARALYSRAGFTYCGPFGSYRPDPNSVFMTLALDQDA